jgi:ABC-type uncharacterized transport system auxiliary subunit
MVRFGKLSIGALLLFTLAGCGTRATALATILNGQEQARDANAAYAEQEQTRQLQEQLQQTLLIEKLQEMNATQSTLKGN